MPAPEASDPAAEDSSWGGDEESGTDAALESPRENDDGAVADCRKVAVGSLGAPDTGLHGADDHDKVPCACRERDWQSV